MHRQKLVRDLSTKFQANALNDSQSGTGRRMHTHGHVNSRTFRNLLLGTLEKAMLSVSGSDLRWSFFQQQQQQQNEPYNGSHPV
jgi:hypothetical protein